MACRSEQPGFEQVIPEWAANGRRKEGHAASIAFRINNQRLMVSASRLEVRESADRPIGDPLTAGFYVYPTNRVYASIDAIIAQFNIRDLDSEIERTR